MSDNAETAIIPEVVEELHHPMGPSNYTNWIECACWDGKEGESTDATRGSYSHLVVESVLRKDPSILEKNIRPECVTNDDVATGELGAELILGIANGAEVHSEDKVRFNRVLEDAMPEMRGVFGTVDAWFEDANGDLHVCDYKTFDRGEKDHTPQMSGYAVLICSNHPEYIGRQIFLHVIAGGIGKVITYVTNFVTAVKLVTRIIGMRKDPNRSPCPGNCCRYCDHAKDCKGSDIVIGAAQNTDLWSKLHMADKMVVIESLEKIIKNFKEDFKSEMKKNRGVIESPSTGVKWVTVEKNPSRKCISIVDLGKDLENHGIAYDTFVNDVCSVSLKSVTEALVKANPGMKAGKAEGIADQFFAIPSGAKKSISFSRVA